MISDRIPRVPPYSGYCYLAPHLRVRGYHTLRPNFPVRFHFVDVQILQSYNPRAAVTTQVWASSVSLATTPEITVVFSSSAYLDVSVQRVRPPCGVTGLQPAGLPHSDIRGSIRVCQSPRLFAAYCVLHRLQEPRHPPYALIYFLTCRNTPFCCASRPFLILNRVNELLSWRIRESNP